MTSVMILARTMNTAVLKKSIEKVGGASGDEDVAAGLKKSKEACRLMPY